MITYAGTNSDAEDIVIPEDTDVADAESVDTALRGLRDSTRLSLQTASKLPIHREVRMHSTDGATVAFSAPAEYVQNKSAVVPYAYKSGPSAAGSFTVADIVPGTATYKANTVYYCYLWFDAGVFTKRITEDHPNDQLTGPAGSDENKGRYLGAFFTNGARQVIPYEKSGGFYTFDPPVEMQTVNNDTVVTYDLTNLVPFSCRRVKLKITGISLSAFVNSTMVSAGGPTHDFLIGLGDRQTISLDLVLRSKVVSARLGTSVLGVTSTLFLDGIWE